MVDCLSSKWHVIYTMPKAEKSIDLELRRKDIETFLPLKSVVRQWSDRKKVLSVPLFPNYLFIKITRSEYHTVLRCKGVVKYISIDDDPVCVSEQEVSLIKQMASLNPEFSEKKMNTGDPVIVTTGGLKGLQGVVVKNRANKMAVHIEILQQIVLIDMPTSYLNLQN